MTVAMGPHRRHFGRMTSALLWGVVGLLTLQVVHLVVRPKIWIVDVPMTVNSYLFSLIFYGAAVAGFGALQGRQFRRIAWLGRMSVTRSLVATWGRAAFVAITVFVAALVAAVAVAVVRFHTPLSFSDGALANLLVGVLGVLGYLSLGFAVGARWPHSLAAPIATAATFGLVMAGWVGGWAMLVGFGNGSLPPPSAMPNPPMLVSRAIFFLALAGAGVLVAASTAGWLDATRRLVAVLAVIAVVAAIWNRSLPYEPFVLRAVRAECAQTHQRELRVCVPARQQRFLRAIVDEAKTEPIRDIIGIILSESVHPPRVWLISDQRYFAELAIAPGDKSDQETSRSYLVQSIPSMLYPYCEEARGVRLEDVPRQELDPAVTVGAWASQVYSASRQHYPKWYQGFSASEPLGTTEIRTSVTKALQRMPECPRLRNG